MSKGNIVETIVHRLQKDQFKIVNLFWGTFLLIFFVYISCVKVNRIIDL